MYLSTYLPFYLSVALSIYLSISLSLYLSIYLSIYLSSIYLSISLCKFEYIHVMAQIFMNGTPMFWIGFDPDLEISAAQRWMTPDPVSTAFPEPRENIGRSVGCQAWPVELAGLPAAGGFSAGDCSLSHISFAWIRHIWMIIFQFRFQSRPHFKKKTKKENSKHSMSVCGGDNNSARALETSIRCMPGLLYRSWRHHLEEFPNQDSATSSPLQNQNGVAPGTGARLSGRAHPTISFFLGKHSLEVRWREERVPESIWCCMIWWLFGQKNLLFFVLIEVCMSLSSGPFLFFPLFGSSALHVLCSCLAMEAQILTYGKSFLHSS